MPFVRDTIAADGGRSLTSHPDHTPTPPEQRGREASDADAPIALSVVIPAPDEGAHLRDLLPRLRAVLAALGVSAEIVIVTPAVDPVVLDAARVSGAHVVAPRGHGFRGALLAGFAASRGAHILTMDADVSDPSDVVRSLWHARGQADLVIASRFVAGGRADMGWYRHALSRAVNALFRWGLSVPVRDLSSNVRLYRASVVREQHPRARGFDVLQQLLVQAYADGRSVAEVPFVYVPRRHGASHGRVFRVGAAYARTFGRLWMLRNSILAADYDDRAHDSRIPLQRYWQRERHRHVMDLIAGEGAVLDVGCGSSRIIAGLPPGSVATDILLRKLRYARRFGAALVQSSAFALPFGDASFPCVLCSQVIEHVPKASPILDELCRVLQRGGRLVLGTPDYANWQWVWIEKLYGIVNPGGYKDEHISHYTFDELRRNIEARGFHLETHRYILRGELIMAFRKR